MSKERSGAGYTLTGLCGLIQASDPKKKYFINSNQRGVFSVSKLKAVSTVLDLLRVYSLVVYSVNHTHAKLFIRFGGQTGFYTGKLCLTEVPSPT